MEASSRTICPTGSGELREPIRKSDRSLAALARFNVIEQLHFPFVPLLLNEADKTEIDQISMNRNKALACRRLEAFVIRARE